MTKQRQSNNVYYEKALNVSAGRTLGFQTFLEDNLGNPLGSLVIKDNFIIKNLLLPCIHKEPTKLINSLLSTPINVTLLEYLSA